MNPLLLVLVLVLVLGFAGVFEDENENEQEDEGGSRDMAAAHPDVIKRLTKLARDFDRRLQSDKQPEASLAR